MRRLTALVFLLLPALAFAQPLPETNVAAFAPLDLPAPNSFRAANGAPGPLYWQNEADYRIEASLDTTTHRLTGTVALTYTTTTARTHSVFCGSTWSRISSARRAVGLHG